MSYTPCSCYARVTLVLCTEQNRTEQSGEERRGEERNDLWPHILLRSVRVFSFFSPLLPSKLLLCSHPLACCCCPGRSEWSDSAWVACHFLVRVALGWGGVHCAVYYETREVWKSVVWIVSSFSLLFSEGPGSGVRGLSAGGWQEVVRGLGRALPPGRWCVVADWSGPTPQTFRKGFLSGGWFITIYPKGGRS